MSCPNCGYCPHCGRSNSYPSYPITWGGIGASPSPNIQGPFLSGTWLTQNHDITDYARVNEGQNPPNPSIPPNSASKKV